MKKIDYIKSAWNLADDKVNENIDNDCTKFNFILGIRTGLTIALRIMNNNWTDTEIKAYLNTLHL